MPQVIVIPFDGQEIGQGYNSETRENVGTGLIVTDVSEDPAAHDGRNSEREWCFGVADSDSGRTMQRFEGLLYWCVMVEADPLPTELQKTFDIADSVS
jgi:hypothetical protein